jgi:hypothetical protein
MQPPIEGNEPVFSLWHSSHESAKSQYSYFPERFKAFLALSGLQCQKEGRRAATRGNSASLRTQIMNMFSGLESAMAQGHYATACNHFSEREQSQIVAGEPRRRA